MGRGPLKRGLIATQSQNHQPQTVRVERRRVHHATTVHATTTPRRTPGTVKLWVPPRQSRGVSRSY